MGFLRGIGGRLIPILGTGSGEEAGTLPSKSLTALGIIRLAGVVDLRAVPPPQPIE